MLWGSRSDDSILIDLFIPFVLAHYFVCPMSDQLRKIDEVETTSKAYFYACPMARLRTASAMSRQFLVDYSIRPTWCSDRKGAGYFLTSHTRTQYISELIKALRCLSSSTVSPTCQHVGTTKQSTGFGMHSQPLVPVTERWSVEQTWVARLCKCLVLPTPFHQFEVFVRQSDSIPSFESDETTVRQS